MSARNTRRTKPSKPKRRTRSNALPPEAEALTKPAAEPPRNCYHCLFCVTNMMLWMRTLFSGFPVMAQCANNADAPGQMLPVPGKACRNFRRKVYHAETPQPPNDSIRYICLTRGLHAIVDAEDYDRLSQYKWQVQPSANRRTYYAKRVYRRRLILMHREIMKPPKGMFVDHINGNGLDNRRCNLRICTPRQNSCNRSKHRRTKHRFIGVQPCSKNTYQATIMHKGKTYRGGTFTDEVEAAKARDRLALKLHGPYARLNFPELRDEGEQETRQTD